MIGSIVEDRYLIENELGEGAMGKVYAARHIKVGRRVAIKVMHEHLAKHPVIVERFAREAMVAARVRHPNLAAVLDVGMTVDRRPLIVLELAPGVPLSEIAVEPLAGARVTNLVGQLLRGLEHAHRAGLIHRDLKPDNILVETTADGVEVPRIVDFGIAIATRSDDSLAARRLTDANTVIGTPFYMSPEQARANDVDHRTDLFSLGVIMYELLAGMPPFPGSSVDVALANCSKEPPMIAERAGLDVDPLLEAFARKLMARQLEDRFQSAREASDALALIARDRIAAARDILAMTTVILPMPTQTLDDEDAPPTRPRRRTRFALALATALVAIIAAAGWSSRQPSATKAPSVDVVASMETPDMQLRHFEPHHVDMPIVETPHAGPAQHPVVARSIATTPTLAAKTSDAAPVTNAADEITVIAPARSEIAMDVSANDVVAKYIAIGKALKTCPASPSTDALWAKYRLIRINEAIATADRRRATIAVLSEIDAATHPAQTI